MKNFTNWVDRFCYRHPRFGIPNLMIYIVIGNVAIWLFNIFDSSIISILAFSPADILRGQIWRLVTFALIPNSYGYLALIAFYFYYFIGSTIEREWGSGKFTLYFLLGMVLTIIYGFILYFVTKISYSVTATYIYLSMFFAFATLYPDMQVLLFFIIPIKMKYLAIVDAVFFLVEVIRMPFPVNLLPVVAILNYLLFCGDWILALIRRGGARQRSANSTFRRQMHQVQHERRAKPYTRKCAVCGRTDTDYPNLEFRYCSRCAGYHCFCIDHINSHVHFTS